MTYRDLLDSGLKIVRRYGTPIHLKKSKKSLTMHNSLKLGNIKPMKKQKRYSPALSGSVSGSPSSFFSSPASTASTPSPPSSFWSFPVSKFTFTPSPLARS